MILTGTLMGGYSTNLFYILWKLMPDRLKEENIKLSDPSLFAGKYGVLQQVTVEDISSNRQSIGGSSSKRVRTKELPGISPLLISKYLLGCTYFMKLSDMKLNLPFYDEEIISVDMSETQLKNYNKLASELSAEIESSMRGGMVNMGLLGKMINSLLAYPDGARKCENVYNSEDELIASAPATKEHLLPKEIKLLEMVKNELSENRKVLICLEHTDTRDIIPDLVERLEEIGVRAKGLYSTTVKPEKREEWLNANGKYIDVLICNPRLIQTGLDLLDFPTIIFFQTGYSVFTLRQASRRSWRIGQDKDVRVCYLTYLNCMQEQALKLMASKMETSLAVEGDLTENGLSSLSSVSDTSMVLHLARMLLGEKAKTCRQSLSEIWNKYKEKNKTNEIIFGDEKLKITASVVKKEYTAKNTVQENAVIGKMYLSVNLGKKIGLAVLYDYVNNFYFSDGKVFCKNRIVGEYNEHNCSINKKSIKLVKRNESYFELCELSQAI
jgi:hypothetical protein